MLLCDTADDNEVKHFMKTHACDSCMIELQPIIIIDITGPGL